MEQEATQGQQQPSMQDEMKAVIERHLAEIEEEVRRRESVWDLIKDGRATIENEEQANAVGRLLVEATEELERVEDLAAQRIGRAKGKLQRLEYIFKGALEKFTKARLAGKKQRSLILDDVRLQLRKVNEHAETESDAELVAWCERFLLEAVTYPAKISLQVVKDWEAKNRKVAPGRIKVEEQDSFNYQGKKD